MKINIPKDTLAYRSWKRFKSNRAALVSIIFISVFTLMCYLPGFTGYEQNEQNLNRTKLPPSGEHWLGTDQLGRDVFTELLHAGQISLRIAFGVGILSTLIGVIVGASAGLYGKWVDAMLMRSTDLFLVVPQMVILMIALKRYGSSVLAIVIVISLISWMYTARLVRSQVVSLKHKEYVESATISGRSKPYIILKHLIPNSWSVIAVSAAFSVAASIMLESVVSFLGNGIKSPLTSWGKMLFEYKGFAIGNSFYLFLGPAIAIFLTVLAFNFISDGLKDALDPQSEQS